MSSPTATQTTLAVTKDYGPWLRFYHNAALTLEWMKIDKELDATPMWKIFELYRLLMKREMFYYDALLCKPLPAEERN